MSLATTALSCTHRARRRTPHPHLAWWEWIRRQVWRAGRPDAHVLMFQGRCDECLEIALAWVQVERGLGRSAWMRAKGLSLVERCQLAAVHGAFAGFHLSAGDDVLRGRLVVEDEQVSASRKRLRAEQFGNRRGGVRASRGLPRR